MDLTIKLERTSDGVKEHWRTFVVLANDKTPVLITQERGMVRILPENNLIIVSDEGNNFQTTIVFYFDPILEKLTQFGPYELMRSFRLKDGTKVTAFRHHSLWYTFDDVTHQMVENKEIQKKADRYLTLRG
jgi:hypothetical protein